MPLVTLELENKKSSPVDGATILKRRLLGAAVIAALAVIFLPLLLDGGGSESRFRRVEQLRTEPPRIIGADGELEVPKLTQPRPTPKTPPAAAEPVANAVDAAGNSAAQSPAKSPAKPLAKPPAKPAQDAPARDVAARNSTAPQAANRSAAPKPQAQPVTASEPSAGVVTNLVAWVVQAGSFSTQENAMALRDQLREQGYPAFVSLAKDTNAPLYRVKVGPLTDREAANRTQTNVQQFLGRETIVRQYP